MTRLGDSLGRGWLNVSLRYLPFADAASESLPLARLLRLSLFQVSIGMALALLNGTLNRVMIVELGVPASLVAVMIALPFILAPLRALIGHRSDTHRSLLGWKRVPYLWLGTLVQFGGFAIMPFALILLSGDTTGPAWIGPWSAALAFLLVGLGINTTQTAGLALATDLAPPALRPRVVALLYVMLLLGMVLSASIYGLLLEDFRQVELIQIIQGTALATMLMNLVALWKQEARNPAATNPALPRLPFAASCRVLLARPGTVRFLAAVALGTMAFSMQDILLEPYGGAILNMPVGATSALTALLAGGSLVGLGVAARLLTRDIDPHRLAGLGALVGLVAFLAVLFAAPMASPTLFRIGVGLIGFGGGLFAVGTLVAAMQLDTGGLSGLALGAWGAVQTTAVGCAIALGGALRDTVAALAASGALGSTLSGPAVGYGAVYQLEIFLLLATLVAIGPLVRYRREPRQEACFGLAQFPG